DHGRVRSRPRSAAGLDGAQHHPGLTADSGRDAPQNKSSPFHGYDRDGAMNAIAATAERPRGQTLRTAVIAAMVAIAFADSSIVVLALPQLYSRFETSITGVSWIVTSYNAAVAVTALAFVFLVHRFRARLVFCTGAVLFLAATIACASAQALWFLIAARCVQGAGAGLLLAGSLSFLPAGTWTLAGTYGAALGPALGGILTQLFDWRAVFVAQAPFAAGGRRAALGGGGGAGAAR